MSQGLPSTRSYLQEKHRAGSAVNGITFILPYLLPEACNVRLEPFGTVEPDTNNNEPFRLR